MPRSRKSIGAHCKGAAFRSPPPHRFVLVMVLGLLLASLRQRSAAQSVLAPPPETPVVPPAMLEFETNRVGSVLPPETPTGVRQEPLLQWGPLSLRPHPFYRFLYGNGILASPGSKESVAVNEVAPGFLIGIGNHFALDYTPTWRTFSSSKFRDTLDHNVLLTGGTTYEDWVFGLSQSYSSTSLPEVETGTQTSEENFRTELGASYAFNSRMSMDLGFRQTFLSAENFTGSREWATLDWLNYQLWPRLTLAAGVGGGYVDVDVGSDMVYEQAQLRARWRATDKISLDAHGGAEIRQFQTGGAGDLLNPIFGVTLRYQPFEVTSLSLSLDRSVVPTYFANQVSEITAFGGGLEQRLLEKLQLSLGGGYSTTKYVSSLAGFNPGRSDDFYFFTARLTRTFLQRGSIAVFYNYTADASNQSQLYSFNTSEVGVELGYRY